MKLRRLAKILWVARRYGLFLIAADSINNRLAKWALTLISSKSHVQAPRGERMRRALEDLGPIFVKFGQLLSTRRDLLPEDVADELAKLQDQVPAFPSSQARELIEASLGRKIEDMFIDFQSMPVASASIAQVHFAVIRIGANEGKKSGGEGAAPRHE